MVRGLQEKQYQLAAQKRHEADIKCSYYQQTVKFFERESQNNRQFNSWTCNETSPYLEKKLKAEKLHQRQSQLKSVLQKEQEQYEKELAEVKSSKNHPRDTSIEALKQKLKEKKAEQSLYLPRDCRRFQSYFYNSRDCSHPLFTKKKTYNRMSHQDTCPWSYDPRAEVKSPVKNQNHVEAAGKSTGVSDEPYFMNLEHHQTGHHSQLLGSGMKELLHEDYNQEPDPKYSARYSRRTLEATNLRGADEDQNPYNYQNQDSPVRTPERKSYSTSPSIEKSHEDETDYQKDIETIKEETLVENGKELKNGNYQHSNSENSESSYPERISPVQTSFEKIVIQRDADSEKAREKTSCENYERERSLPWMRDGPREQNLSVQMFRYLAHNDMKNQILDLGKRELLACRKQWWSQALRLRDMRNRLELMREKNLYNTMDLHLDEETKKIGLSSIELRAAHVTEREEVCKNSAIYDEDAKDIWKKWVIEDDEIAKLHPPEQRDLLLKKLEEEWKSLAIKDKDRVSDLYNNIISKSELENEHKLADAIRTASLAIAEDQY